MGYDRLPDDQTGTDVEALAYLNREFQKPDLTSLGGMPRLINADEQALAAHYATTDLGYVPGQPVSGRMVNGVGVCLPPYVFGQLREQPFADAPFCLTCPRVYSYDHTLPSPIAADFVLADLWGREVPGAPYVPRGSSRRPDKVLTYLLYAYPRSFWPVIFAAHVYTGYNRFYVSWPDARDAGGFSVDQFVDLCGTVSANLSCGVFLSAKGRYAGNDIDGDPQDMSVQQYQDRIGPILEALLAAHVVREVIPAWEMGLFNQPGQVTQDICKWVGQRAHARSVECGVHFQTEYWAWQAGGQEGDAFWEAIGADVDALNYQSSPTADIGWVQAKLVDVLNHMARFGVKVRGFELRAEAQWDSDRPTEREAGIFAYLVACTRASMAISGSCNGWVQP